MSPLGKKALLTAACCFAAGMLLGCSDPNTKTLIDPNTGKHVASWMTGTPITHGVTAEQDFGACTWCHGLDYRGGIAKVSCYGCHNGPGMNHPNPGWVVPLSLATMSTIPYHKTDTANCAKCHGTDYLGGGSHIACVKCHLEDRSKVHVLAWYPDVQLNHRPYVLANGTGKCQNGYCHGLPTLTVNVWNSLSGPHCNGTCHIWPL